MKKQVDMISPHHGYSYSSLLKAGAVFFSTVLSYRLLSSFNWASTSNRELGSEKSSESPAEITTFSLITKRVVQQFKTTLPSTVNLAQLDGNNGFAIPGLTANDDLGWSVSTAGDFNGDGLADIVLGDPSTGAVYVVFGQYSGWPASFNLTRLNGSNGFVVHGLSAGDGLGSSVSTAGDFNGDGLADIVLGASDASPGGVSAAGEVYVVFGHRGGWSPTFNLTALNGTNGFIIPGISRLLQLGYSVSTAGDINNDGFSDIILGAPNTDTMTTLGTVYVLFGRANAWPTLFSLSSLNGVNGFIVLELNWGDGIGELSSVSTAGDINGDGYGDLLLGAYSYPSGVGPGAAFILFGQAGGWPISFNLTTLNGTNGFMIPGLIPRERLGFSVSSAGDINGDGFSDIILGAPDEPPCPTNCVGAIYILFGQRSGWKAIFDLTTLNGTNGFKVLGGNANYLYYNVGSFVSNIAGDFNKDGLSDFVLDSFVLFGSRGIWAPSFNLTMLNGENGFIVPAKSSSMGDFNGDGFSDLVIGTGNSLVHVVFGNPSNFFLVNNQLTFTGSRIVTLIITDLTVIYPGNSSSLVYTVSNVTNGYFQLTSQPGSVITTFSQTALINQLVQFVYNGSDVAPFYEISVNDGILQTPWSPASITFPSSIPPIIINYTFAVANGGSVILTTTDIGASDPNIYGNNATLLFQIFNLQRGQFVTSSSGTAISQFQQQDIILGNVKFIHDGSDVAPFANLQVFNSAGQNSSIVSIGISLNNGTTIIVKPGSSVDITGPVAGGAVGGTIFIAGAIGGGFWYRKRAQDAATRKQHRFADHIRDALKLKGIDNFESEKGQRFLAVIQKLENGFSTQGGMTLSEMGDNELEGLAKQVAISARNKITSSTTLFAYSIIKPDDFNDRKISEIVQDVLRMRVGQDDTHVPMASL